MRVQAAVIARSVSDEAIKKTAQNTLKIAFGLLRLNKVQILSEARNDAIKCPATNIK